MIKKEKLQINDIGMKVLSVALAVLIWILVANINDPLINKHFSDVAVTVKNEDALTDNGYAYEITEGEEVSFTVKGRKSIVANLDVNDFLVVADFSKLSLTDAIPIDVSAKKYDGQVEINLGTINTMKIKKDEIISVSLPVNVTVSGTVKTGYYPGETVATPNLIRVSGPKNLLNNAKEIRVDVDADGIGDDITATVKPVLYDQNGDIIQSSQISMDASSINVSVKLWKTKTVKVNLSFEGKPESGYVLSSFDYEPKTVLAAASSDVYQDLDSLELASVDISGATRNYEKDIAVSSDSFPDGVVLAEKLTSIKVNAKIEKLISRNITFKKDKLTVKNNKRNYKVTYSDLNTYYVLAEGATSIVNVLKIEDFSPWIDLSDLDEGEHTVKIHVKEIDGVSVDSTAKITITLTER